MDGLTGWMTALLLVSLRVAPVFAFAPPFTLVRLPLVFRLLFGIGLSTGLVASYELAGAVAGAAIGELLAAGVRELLVGAVFVLAFQLMFAALYFAGRTVDIQAGFGLAAVFDPTTRAQTPLVGTLFAYAAGAVFFAMNGHHELVRLFGASLDLVPLGTGHAPTSLAPLLAFISAVFIAGFGVAGGAVLCLFLADLAISLLSRTVPQMNVLVLGLQLKTVLLLLILPFSFGMSGALFARMSRLTLEAIPRLL